MGSPSKLLAMAGIPYNYEQKTLASMCVSEVKRIQPNQEFFTEKGK